MPDVLRPGDKLIVGIPVGSTLETADRGKKDFAIKFPGCELVYIVGAVGMIIYRPEATDA